MFNCAVCQEVSEPREKPVKVVVETRERKAPRKGIEIVKEVITHEECVAAAKVGH